MDRPRRPSVRADDGPRTPAVLLVSSVRIGPLTELRRALADELEAEVALTGALSDADWRRSRGGGRLAVLRARVRSLLFPLVVRTGGRRGPVVVATTNPFWLPTALALRRVRPLVALVYDVYPDALQVRWAVPRRLARAVDHLVGYGLRRADAVVVLGPRVATLLRTRHRLPAPPVVIPTGADQDDHATEERRPETGVLLSYVGNTGSMHEGRTLGAALREVVGRHEDARILVATRGDRAGELLTPLRGAPRTTLRGPLDDAEFRSTLAATDVALVTLDAAAGAVSMPSKVYPALAAGCAVLAVAPRDSDLADLVRDTGAGLVVEPGDVAGAVAALELLVTDHAARAAHAASARRAAGAFTPAALAAAWSKVLRPLMVREDGRSR